jgi:hypothetical protein
MRTATALAIDPQLALRLAAEAPCDPRTAAAAIARGSSSIRGLTGYRVCRAMRVLGIDDPAPAIVGASTDAPKPAERSR